MKDIKPHSYDPELWDDDQNDPTTFQPLRKQTDGSTNAKSERRQRDKEWGRSISKFHKQRDRTGKP